MCLTIFKSGLETLKKLVKVSVGGRGLKSLRDRKRNSAGKKNV